jgi:cytochrome P450
MANPGDELYYDPYDFEIDANPHRVWRRMRDEAPLYRNDKYDFWALSRFSDVEAALQDWRTYSSAKGTLLELIKATWQPPPGMFIFEDPPLHDVHRKLLSRVFTPRRMAAIEPQIRTYCARSLDPLVGSGGFDFVADLGAQMPMRVIGMLLGIPEEDQEAIRDGVDASLKLADGEMPDALAAKPAEIGAKAAWGPETFGEYIAWRRKHPSDDLMTELLNATFEDDGGETRQLRDDELVAYVLLLAGAGNETTTRLIAWTGQLLGEHPDQRARVAADRSLLGNTIEEVLRFEAPSPVQARCLTRDVEIHGARMPEGSAVLLVNGSANRDERRYPDADRFDVGRKDTHHLSFGTGVHFCIGANLARLEGCVALDEVLKRWPDWEVDRVRAKRAHTSTVRGWERLPVLV